MSAIHAQLFYDTDGTFPNDMLEATSIDLRGGLRTAIELAAG